VNILQAWLAKRVHIQAYMHIHNVDAYPRARAHTQLFDVLGTQTHYHL